MSSAEKRVDRETLEERLFVVQLAVRLLGNLALKQRPGATLTPAHATELYDALFAALEVLNNEKGDS